MLDFEDNNFKLLRMKEKLLDVTDNNRDTNLLDYREAAQNIDNMYFKELIDKLKESDNEPLSLEDELKYLSVVKEMYEQLEFMQYKFRNVYGKYTDDILELNDLSRVNQDIIIDRINNISGYLINLKNINQGKKELEELSNQLILENKKKEVIETRILEYEDELRNNFLNAEGRKIMEGSIKYTSVLQEFNEIGIDLEKILEDSLLLKETLNEVSIDKKEKDEMLKATEVCYNNLPNRENREVLETVRLDAYKAGYKLALVKMAKLVSEYTKDYDKARKKREDLIDLVKYRNTCVEKVGIKFSIDPFSRIKINLQLDAIHQLGSNSKTIASLMKKIDVVNSKLEDTIDKNEELLLKINSKVELLNDELSISDISLDFISDEIVEHKKIEDNQVIKVELLPSKFKIDRAIEKTTGVINRVYQMVNGYDKKVEEKIQKEATPELIIEDVMVDKHQKLDLPVLDDLSNEIDNDVFEDIFVNNEEKVLEEIPVDEEDNIFEDIPEVISDVSLESVKEDNVELNDSLFEDVVPFEGVSLFSDRTDEDEFVFDDVLVENEADLVDENVLVQENDNEVPVESISLPEVVEDAEDTLVEESLPDESVIVNNSDNNEEVEMPELEEFWEIHEDDTISKESLDYQLSKLLSNDDEDVKSRKLTF